MCQAIRIHGPTKGNERIMACKRMLSFSAGSHNGWGGKGTGLLDLMSYDVLKIQSMFYFFVFFKAKNVN